MEMERREMGSLIGSDKVEDTAVHGADDQKIGSIERVMIDKVSGHRSALASAGAAEIQLSVSDASPLDRPVSDRFAPNLLKLLAHGFNAWLATITNLSNGVGSPIRH